MNDPQDPSVDLARTGEKATQRPGHHHGRTVPAGHAAPQGRRARSRSCDELEALITQHLRIATAILYVALAGELAAVGLL
jgi:hypothetical protein